MSTILVNILGLSSSPSALGTFALILKEANGNRRLPIIIGSSEAQSIALELENIKPPRPLTHDLIKNLMEAFDTSITKVIIDDLKDGVFFAKIYLDVKGADMIIDSRPSDAIALAVRSKCDIFVKNTIMDEASIEPNEEDESIPEPDEDEMEEPFSVDPESEQKTPSAFGKLEALEQQLAKAIANEDYETAAKIRDEIQKLKS